LAGLTTADKRASDKLRELERCKRSLWYLATEYLGYEWSPKHNRGLTERIHYPICRWIDKHGDVDRLGLWMARSRHKTTVVVCRIIQNILIDPCKSHMYWHAVDSLASDFVLEVGLHLRNNQKLRSLDPVGVDEDGKRYAVFPRKNATRWMKTAKGESSLLVNRHKKYGAGTRAPTLKAQGAGAASDGSHIDGEAWLDDIIIRQTIERSELMKIQRWTQSTVFPIVDSNLIRGIGTPWAEVSVHQLWMMDPGWRTLIVPGAICESDEEYREMILSGKMKVHFSPDYTFTNPTFGPAEFRPMAIKMLKTEQHEMRGDFSPQIMIDPEPESEKPWETSHEQYCSVRKGEDGTPGAFDGNGVVVVLSDPAPWKQGSWKGISEKIRADGTKDLWSLAVLRVRVRDALWEAILLDGLHSLEWGEDAGCDEICALMKKWHTNIYVSEDANTWYDRMIIASRRNAVAVRREDKGGPFKYDTYNQSNRKNVAFSALADLNRNGTFWICDTVPREYLEGDGEHTGFLTQARKWRPVGLGKNNLRFDDDADVVSRVTDALFKRLAPQTNAPPAWMTDSISNFEEEHDVSRRSRYCGI